MAFEVFLPKFSIKTKCCTFRKCMPTLALNPINDRLGKKKTAKTPSPGILSSAPIHRAEAQFSKLRLTLKLPFVLDFTTNRAEYSLFRRFCATFCL